MANSDRLSEMQKSIGGGKKLTEFSKYMENNVKDCLKFIIKDLETKMKIKLKWEKSIELKTIIEHLRKNFAKEEWFYKFDKSSMRPDGGILYLIDGENNKFPVLITEMKKQGTNDRIITMAGKAQAVGNAIERLGKNVIGLRTWMLNESIFPFVCFGWGCDFDDKSSILDRVITIAEFGELNKTYLHNTNKTNRGSFYFQNLPLTKVQMLDIMLDIARRSIQYYFSKYGEEKYKVQ